MGRENSGRGGLSPHVVTAVLKLLALDPPLKAGVIAQRLGIHATTVRRFRQGRHRSQRVDERGAPLDVRGGNPRKIRLALRLLGRQPPPPLSAIARRLKMSRRVVRLLRDGEYITQRR
jgi:hypothetical protein